MDIFDEVLGGISLKIVNGNLVCHTESWRETKTKLYSTVWSIKRGNVHINIYGAEYVAKEGDVIFFSPGDTYTAWTDTGCEFVFIFFNLDTGYPGSTPIESNVSGLLSGRKIAMASKSFCKEYTEKSNNKNHPGIDAYAVFLRFITDMMSAIKDKKCTFFQKKGAKYTSTDMQHAIEYMSDHFIEGISVKDVAKRFGFSEKYFITRFKSITGMPPKKYLIECRMRLAAELVRDRDKSISEIAQKLGYPDQFSFSRAFKNHYGEPPSAFR